MTEQLKVASIFVELDALIDTRISVLWQMDGAETIKTILQADYHNRPIDMFEGIDNTKFKKLYDNRTKDCLKESMLTGVIDVIREFAYVTLSELVNSPRHFKPKVIINTYPYVLSEEEDNVLIATMVHLTNKLCDVQIVHMTYEEITPSYVKNNLEIIVLYEYYKWLEVHAKSEAIKRVTCPEVTMFGPRIYFKPKDPTVDVGDVYKAMEELAGPFIGLKLMPVSLFSFCLKKAKA